jgi:hypothetical protein
MENMPPRTGNIRGSNDGELNESAEQALSDHHLKHHTLDVFAPKMFRKKTSRDLPKSCSGWVLESLYSRIVIPKAEQPRRLYHIDCTSRHGTRAIHGETPEQTSMDCLSHTEKMSRNKQC